MLSRSLFLSLALVCAAQGASLVINLQPTFGAEQIRPDSLRYTLPSAETISVNRLSCLWSGFALRKVDGTWVEISGSGFWTDLGQRRQQISLSGVPEGEYTAVRFFCGPDASANAAKPDLWPPTHPLNPNVNGLHWSWQGGYIFLAIEGLFRQGNDAPQGYSYHFARDANRTAIEISAKLVLPTGGTCALNLPWAIDGLLRGLSPAKDGTSTHSRDGDPLAAKLKDNLPQSFASPVVAAAPEMPTPPPPAKPLYLPVGFHPYPFSVGAGFPIPQLPKDNPLLMERVTLGKRLFAEPLLSRTASISCASCHSASQSFSDPRAVSLGVEGRAGTRNAMALVNLAWKSSYFWDGRAATLRQQALMPIQDHAEMDESLDLVVQKLTAHPEYPGLFAAAFHPGEITADKVGLALENYLLTLTSYNSRFDRHLRGAEKFSTEESRGFELFFSEYEPRSRQFGADCFHCHGGATFSDHQFHNNGIGDEADLGLFALTKKESDRGKFVVPTLRNIALTAPYMHDGRFQTLDQVIEHYATGIHRSATLDPNLAKHPGSGIPLSPDDRKALIAFLRTLTEAQGTN